MATGRLPTFLIIGVPKAGTAALSYALGHQPGVFAHPAKELHFFDDRAKRGLDWYRSQFQAAGAASAVGEATPTYALRDEWVAAAAAALPDARIILQVRHPIDRFWSSYWFFRIFGLESRSVREAARQDMGRPPSPDDRMCHVAAGWYDEIYQRVLNAWPEDQVLVIDAADLRQRPETVVARAARHVGVESPISVKPGTSHNRVTLPRSDAFHRAYVALARRGWIRSHGRGARWLLLSRRRPPPLEPDLRQLLLEHYTPHIDRFEGMLGREFPDWRS